MSFLIKIHSPSHKRVAECSCTVVHTHMSQNSKRSHALRRALSGGEHLPGRSADARGPQICDTRIHVLSTRKQNKLFVCGTLLRGGASSGPRLAFRHRWCLSPTEVCFAIRTFQLRKARGALSSVGHHDGDYGVAAPRRLIEPDVGPGVWLGLGLGAGWHDRPGPNDRWAGDAPLRHDGPRFFAPFSPSANRARKRSKRRLVRRAPPNSSSRA